MTKPLEGLTVLEFSQFLSGPYAGLRLADLGARVLKLKDQKLEICVETYISVIPTLKVIVLYFMQLIEIRKALQQI